MTLYSCLPTQGKFTVIATWPGEYADSHSAKVTTFTDSAQASRLADDLTRVSESMWDAAAWLDVYDEAESRLSTIIDATRETTEVIILGDSLFDGCRHAQTWTGGDLANTLGTSLPVTLNSLTRAQRLSVADELEADAAARTESLQLLPTGSNPTDSDSRIWQAAEITLVTKMGATGTLPDGAAGWMARVFDTDRSATERWGARNLLHRLEQLAAAAKSINARGGVDLDAVFGPQHHLVIPAALFGVHIDHDDHAGTKVSDEINPAVAHSSLAEAYREQVSNAEFIVGDAVLYIGPDIDMQRTAPWDRDVFSEVKIQLSQRGSKATLAKLEATDTAGFVKVLGNWVTNASFRA